MFITVIPANNNNKTPFGSLKKRVLSAHLKIFRFVIKLRDTYDHYLNKYHTIQTQQFSDVILGKN